MNVFCELDVTVTDFTAHVRRLSGMLKTFRCCGSTQRETQDLVHRGSGPRTVREEGK